MPLSNIEMLKHLLPEDEIPIKEQFLNPEMNESTKIEELYVGKLAKPEMFCTVVSIMKWPQRYISDKELAAEIEGKYFSDTKFWARCWDVYYVWSTQAANAKPIHLVQVDQVNDFLDTINTAVDGANLCLASADDDSGLVLNFNDNHPRVLPRFLCRSFSIRDYADMSRNTPGPTYRPPEEPTAGQEPSEEVMMRFNALIQRAQELSKPKKASKKQRKDNRVHKQHQWKKDLKQTERFLGLRPEDPDIAQAGNPDETWEEYQAKEATIQAKLHPSAIKVTNPPSYAFDASVVFIAIDVECWERDKRKITEIGVSTLDTLDLANIPPGENGKGWYNLIRSRHFRIKEHSHLHNEDYIVGCADDFRFGESEWISLGEMPQAVASVFRAPYSAPPGYVQKVPNNREQVDKRTVVLVGHDFANDIRYLERIGFSVRTFTNLHKKYQIIDTQGIYRAYTRNLEPDKLSKILETLDVDAWGLHNAGNDARYTMQAMIGIAVKNAGERNTEAVKERHEETKQFRIAQAVKAATERVIEEAEGWNSDGEDSGISMG